MTLQCLICNKWVEKLYSLPCDDQHQMCQSCIEVQNLPGNSLKCHICRKIFGSVNISLLKVEGADELPPEQSCGPCRRGRKPKVVKAEWYCADCDAALCMETYDIHEQAHSHQVVPFKEYQMKSGKVKVTTCGKQDHQSLVVDLWCEKCGEPACRLCEVKPSRCQTGDHDFKPLNTWQSKLKNKVGTEDGKLKQQRNSVLTCKKRNQDSMEALRLHYKELEEEALRVEEEKIRQIKRESAQTIQQLQDNLKRSADSVMNLCERIDAHEVVLTQMIDGLSSLVEFNHAVEGSRLLTEMKIEESLKT